MGTELPLPGLQTNVGVLLVDPSQPALAITFGFVLGGGSSHSYTIPNDPTLLGLRVYVQGFISDVGGVGKLVNGLDLVIGV